MFQMSYFLMYTRYASVYSRVCSASEFHLQPAKQDEWMHALVRVQRIYSPHTTQIRDLSLSFGNAIDATAIRPCIATRRAAATSPKARTPSRTEFERLSDRTFRSNNPKRLRYDPYHIPSIGCYDEVLVFLIIIVNYNYSQ